MKRTIIALAGILLAACAASQLDTKHESPNYDFSEGVFKNTNPVKMHSFWEMFWASITSDTEPAVWPEWVEAVSDKHPVRTVENNDVRITFVNHATFLIQTGGFNILTDPVFSERTSPFSFVGPKRVHIPGIDISDLPKIDVVIISHDHYDHLDLASIEQLIERDNPEFYMGLGVGERFDGLGNVTEMDWWESAQVDDDFRLWFLDVQHFSGRTLTDRNSTLWGGFMLEISGKKIYFGGDSGYADHYKRTFERFGPTDIAFLPIGAYAPREFFRQIHLNPAEAVQAHMDLQSGFSIGMHYGTFQLSAEPMTEPSELLSQAKAEAGLDDSAFITMNTGEPLVLASSPETEEAEIAVSE